MSETFGSDPADDQLVPSRRARRTRRRIPDAPQGSSSQDPLIAILSAVVALQNATDGLADEMRDLRRRMSALVSRIEVLDQRLVGSGATDRLRGDEAREQPAWPPTPSAGGS